MRFKAALIVALLALVCIPVMMFAGAQNPLQLVISAPPGPIQGDTLQLTATLTNISDQDVKVIQIMGDPKIAYRFTVRDAEHHRVEAKKQVVNEDENQITQNSAIPITLQPHQQFTETIDLGNLYDLRKSGTYTIQAERYIPQEIGFSFTISNEIKVDVDNK